MQTPSRREVAAALADIIRDELIDRRPVELPGWGTFTVEHREGRTETRDGTTAVHPPRDTVTFQPEHH